jgi:hypothetical protein
MKKLSAFDIGIIIAFVVITLLGAGACYYLAGVLDATKSDVSAAAGEFEKYSSHEPYLPTTANEKILSENIDLMHAQLDPVIQNKLQAAGNKLPTIVDQDTVAWKHDLDAEVSRLNSAAKLHGVNVPNNFYYGFSRYLNQNPREDQTIVLSKQLLGVEQIANIFIAAPVKTIYTFRRTYEEDPESNSASSKSDSDLLPGRVLVAPGNTYSAYPFEIEFEATTPTFRKVINGLENSPYVFIIRTINVKNSNPASPQISDLQKFSDTSNSGVLDSSPGATASAPKSSRGPQFLFGNETLHIKIRVDMIEWKGMAEPGTAPEPGNGRGHRNGGRGRGGSNGGNGAFSGGNG